MNQRIFIIDDDPDIIEMASRLLELDRFVVSSSTDPIEGIKKIEQNPPDLLLLDICMDKKDGLVVCRELKQNPKTSHVPIVMVSAKTEEADVVVGLEMGADDYIDKPFRGRELLARIKSVLRRHAAANDAAKISVGPFKMDFGAYKATMKDQPLDLTPKEFELLGLFLRKEGRVLTRASISEAVWGADTSKTSHTVDSHIDKLRKKMGPCGKWIVNLKGVGYRFEIE